MVLPLLTLLSLLATCFAAGADPILISGNKFFFKTNGSQFYIKGVAYQADVTAANTNGSQSFVDPLADPAGCMRDIPYLQALGTNTVRVYAIDTTQDHSQCMEALSNAGIYLIADLSQPTNSINREAPAWTTDLFTRYTSVVDALANYTNVVGFFAGNEVVANSTNSAAAAFVKAAVRDTKAYIKAQGYRPIGIGYSANDDAGTRDLSANFFSCGPAADAVDFYGLNMYEWCGMSTFATSGYSARTKEFSNFTVPIFLSEYGCINPLPRTFDSVQAIYGPDMDTVWSGGIVYEYFEEANNYGLVSVSGSQVSKKTDYNILQSQLAKATPTLVQSASFTPTNTQTRTCPSVMSAWSAMASPLPPAPNSNLCGCMMDSLLCAASPNINMTALGDLFGVVCGLSNTACQGILANGTTATYGAYSMCNTTEQLSFILNQYYLGQKKVASACDFSGSATLVSAQSTASSCASLLSAAGSAGTQTVSATAAAGSGGSARSSGSSGSGTGSAASASSSSASAGLTPSGLRLQWAIVATVVSLVLGVLFI